MELEEVRGLKQQAMDKILGPMVLAAARSRALAYGAAPFEASRLVQPQRLLALGISRKGSSYQLAIRLQRHSMLDRPEIQRLHKLAHGEVDVRFIGRVAKRVVPWYQRRQRPLLIGCSVGHHRITAGTLGAFVRPAGDAAGTLSILSNNHVLADENRGKAGDAILQPGQLDGGVRPADRVAALQKFVRLKKTGNLVDCAIASVEGGIDAKLRQLRDLGGTLQGLSLQPLDTGLRVQKVGRTTGATQGRVTAFELDDVVVAFDTGNLRFDRQIEIEGLGDRPFSDGGDSGALIVDSDFGAVGLLFAGSDSGGKNNKGLTYANPIGTVLASLKVQLAIG